MFAKKKLLVLIPDDIQGGAERQLGLLLTQLETDGVDVTLKRVVSIRRREIDVPILGLAYKILCRISLIANAASVVFQFKNVIAYNAKFLPLALLCKLLGKRFFFSIRERNDAFYSHFNRMLLRSVYYLYTNTQSITSGLNQFGLECHLFKNFVSHKECFEKRYCQKKANDIYIVVSNAEPHKRVEDAVRALEGLDAELHVYGSLNNKLYVEKCKKIAADCKVRVEFHGSVGKEILTSAMYRASALLHPSIMEGTSNAIIDAISFGLPAIVADTAENAMLVNNSELFTFESRNPEDLKSKIIALKKASENEVNLELEKSFLKNKAMFSDADLNRLAEEISMRLK